MLENDPCNKLFINENANENQIFNYFEAVKWLFAAN